MPRALDLVERLVEDVARVVDLAAQEVEAAEQREGLAQRLRRSQPARALERASAAASPAAA